MAERLTIRAEEDGIKAVWYGDRDVFLEGEVGYAEADKLAHYEDLAEQGRLIELPCKPFEKVWVAHLKFPTHQTMFCCNTHILETMEGGYVIGYTKEEAEAELKELRGEQE